MEFYSSILSVEEEADLRWHNMLSREAEQAYLSRPSIRLKVGYKKAKTDGMFLSLLFIAHM